MNFTHAQICFASSSKALRSELLLEVANCFAYSSKALGSENGTNLLMQMTLDTFMRSERVLHQLDNPRDYGNGFRTRTTHGFGKEMVLKVPRTRSGTFYPALLGVLRNEDEEHRKLIFSLYRKELYNG